MPDLNTEALQARTRHVYWLGGGTGGGKSTIAHRLAAAHRLSVYDTDAAMSKHTKRTSPDDSPFLHKFVAMDMDERWLNRSPETMLETFHWYRGEGFHLIVDDLLNSSAQPGVIVEGFRVLPHLVKPLLATPRQAVWLLPTPEFREAAFASRGSTWTIAQHTSDPEKARRNLLERDRQFTERLAAEVKRLDLQAIEVDAAMTEEELTTRVAAAFGLGHGDQEWCGVGAPLD
jgi:2-phosphoglycerate kinase